MDLEEAYFILEQVTISKPCLNGYTYISVEQFDEAIHIVDEELKNRMLKIQELERELEQIKNKQKQEENVKYNIAKSLIGFNKSKNELAMI